MRHIIIVSKTGNMEPGDITGFWDTKEVSIPYDGWVRGIRFRPVNVDKKNIHHFSFKRQIKDKDYPLMAGESIFAASMESFLYLPPVDGYAFTVNKGDKILFTSHLYNPSEKAFMNAGGTVEFDYIPKNSGQKFGELLAYRLDAACELCFDPTFFIEPHSEVVLSAAKQVRFNKDAQLVVASAHLHPGGKKIDLILNGEVIHTFLPKYTDGFIESINTFEGFSFKKGDVLDAKAYYKNDTDKTIDGMAIVLLYAAAGE